ncbi:hypothetical protein HanRHA438_Chr11g0491101 [Helianthus annuus]|nr:hypothetical protein HanRHA438_Chr11g0491101 [Helianthus annuus]
MLLKPSHKPKSIVPVNVFLGGWFLRDQIFESFLTTKSLAMTRPLLSPFLQSVTSPLS